MNKKKKEYVLAYSDSWDSGVAVINKNGKIDFALNEERLSRVKMDDGFPKHSMNFLKNQNKEIKFDKIIRGGYISYFNKSKKLNQLYYSKNFITNNLEHFPFIVEIIRRSMKYSEKFTDFSKSKFDHHLCHAASAYYTSGFKKALVITLDAYGDNYASTVYIGKNNNLKLIKRYGWGSTIAHLYTRLTQYMGFKAHIHEGKLTGLAAYGDPKKCYHIMEKLVWIKDDKIGSAKFLRAGFKKEKYESLFNKFKKEDVAAALQKRSEDIVTEFISYWQKKTGLKNICLAGGVFANVKINQKIHELPETENIYIFPHMGDGGLAVGAGLAYFEPTPKKLENVYFGQEYSDKKIKVALDNSNLNYKYIKNIEKKIAKLLAKGKVVAIFNGRMEYGPRALGNRSILYRPDDKSVNDWLNKQLKRTEFMPFAPVVLKEHSQKCFKNIKGAEHTSKFMTITFDCTDWFKKNCPGVVHVDGTARPQIIQKEDNKSYYSIVYEFYKCTGLPCLINTSFNIHEEPIVCAPEDAIKAFKMGNLDYLAIGNFLVKAL